MNDLIYTTKENTFTVSDVNPLDVLLEQDYVKEVLGYVGEKVSINEHFKAHTRSYTRHYFEKDTVDEPIAAVQHITFAQLNARAILSVFEAKLEDGTKSTDVTIEYLDHTDSLTQKKYIISYVNRVKDLEESFIFNEELELPEMSTQGDFQAKVISCFDGGCCKLNGEQYKWCGMGCGSGTPINKLDTCCRNHDYCYGTFPSMKDRCECDRILISCSKVSGVAASSLVIAAFNLKLARCVFS